MKLIQSLFFCAFVNFSNAQTIITYGEAFNFDVGDEFHYTGSFLATNDGGFQNYTYYSRKFTIVSKNFSTDGDTVYYQREGFNFNESANLLTEIDETVYITNLDNSIVGADSVFIDLELYLGKTIHMLCDTVALEDEEFYGVNKAEYVEGLGSVKSSYYADYGIAIDDSQRSLRYFYKSESGEEWGTPLTLSITDQFDGSDYHVFPNPSKGIINWEYESHLSVPSKIEVLDLTGRTVFIKSDEIHDSQIDLSTLRSGTYILKLKFKDSYLSKRIVLQAE